jgi:hypothetical protein
MSSDYNDVDKLLKHMHMPDFSYRTFKRGEASSGARTVQMGESAQSVQAVPPENAAHAGPQPQLKPETLPQTQILQPQSPVHRPQPPGSREPLVAVVDHPQPVHTVAPPVFSASLAAAYAAPLSAAPSDSRISEVLERLSRGSVAASGPRLHLQLQLPPRPDPLQAAPQAEASSHSVDEVLRRLGNGGLTLVKPAVRGER